MVQVLRARQAPHTLISVAAALVAGALDLSQMDDLVQGGGSLVLAVAGGGQGGQGGEVQRAVDHVALAGEGVSQNTATAGRVDVGAVVLGVAGGVAAAFGGGLGEDLGDGRPGGRGRGLEVLDHLGCGAFGGGGRGGGCEGAAVGEGVASGCSLGAGAVGLDDGALVEAVMEVAADFGGCGSVDGGRHYVGGQGDGADDVVGVRVCVGVRERTGHSDVVETAGCEIMHLSRIP